MNVAPKLRRNIPALKCTPPSCLAPATTGQNPGGEFWTVVATYGAPSNLRHSHTQIPSTNAHKRPPKTGQIRPFLPHPLPDFCAIFRAPTGSLHADMLKTPRFIDVGRSSAAGTLLALGRRIAGNGRLYFCHGALGELGIVSHPSFRARLGVFPLCRPGFHSQGKDPL